MHNSGLLGLDPPAPLRQEVYLCLDGIIAKTQKIEELKDGEKVVKTE